MIKRFLEYEIENEQEYKIVASSTISFVACLGIIPTWESNNFVFKNMGHFKIPNKNIWDKT